MKLIIIAIAIGLVVTIAYKKGVFSTIYTNILLYAGKKMFTITLSIADEDNILSFLDYLLKRYGNDNVEDTEVVCVIIYEVFAPWYKKNHGRPKAEHINDWLLDKEKLLNYYKNKEES